MTEPTSALRGKQRAYLRGLGMSLEPVVFVGKQGVTDAVVAEIDSVLKQRELVKLRLQDTVGGDRKEIARELAGRVGCELVQVLGRTVLLYRRNEEKPVLVLPA
ncbi:MAG: ribosome assembly RNA-binding protein YhbY [bacterium]